MNAMLPWCVLQTFVILLTSVNLGKCARAASKRSNLKWARFFVSAGALSSAQLFKSALKTTIEWKKDPQLHTVYSTCNRFSWLCFIRHMASWNEETIFWARLRNNMRRWHICINADIVPLLLVSHTHFKWLQQFSNRLMWRIAQKLLSNAFRFSLHNICIQIKNDEQFHLPFFYYTINYEKKSNSRKNGWKWIPLKNGARRTLNSRRTQCFKCIIA